MRMALPATSKSSPPVPPPAWHHLEAEDVLKKVHGHHKGLPSAEARKRLAEHGRNELNDAARVNPWRIAADQFRSLVIWILIFAGILSAVLGEGIEAIAILVVVVLNAVIGFSQEYHAERSMAALKQMTAPQAKVRRDNKVQSIPAAELVTGDLLVLESGDLVAADARLLRATALTCVESSLTGESEAVGKHADRLEEEDVALGDRTNMIFMGTSVATGTARAVVVATGMQTELGQIAGLIVSAGVEERTPLERKLEAFGRVLVWAALGIVALLFGLGLLRQVPLMKLFMTSVSLAVAAVPEGLPAIVTVALALGVSRMARRRALVRKLSAVETLGSTNVICTDKTGTLTVGEMTVQALWVADQNFTVTGEGYDPTGEVQLDRKKAPFSPDSALTDLATNLVACNNAHLVQEKERWMVIGDPTEGALLAAGIKVGVDRESLEKTWIKHAEIPFDSDRKRSTIVRSNSATGQLRAFCNGATSVLLELCSHIRTVDGVRPMTATDREHILAQGKAMAEQALRVLGSAYRDLPDSMRSELTDDKIECELVFLGLSGLHDPPRPEAREAVAKCRTAGIRVVMITGDSPHTATAIARDLGIAAEGEVAVTGSVVDKMTDDELQQKVTKISVYARVTAAHKLRIIHAWKANDAVVAMTGDGVNDAPAIKGADIGIAMGKGGTEVTRQAADMIIMDDNFATIVIAVEEGRGIYENIRKTLQYLLAGSTAELLLMAICVIVGTPSPLLPIHLLWINLITDGLPALCLATDAIDSDVMQRPPRHRLEKIADRGFLRTMVFTGLITTAVTLGVYYYMLRTQSLEIARSAAFTVLVLAEILRAFGARSETKSVWQISLLTNPRLVFVVGLSFGLQLLSQQSMWFGGFLKTEPLPWLTFLWLLVLACIPSVVLEMVKLWRRR